MDLADILKTGHELLLNWKVNKDLNSCIKDKTALADDNSSYNISSSDSASHSQETLYRE